MEHQVKELESRHAPQKLANHHFPIQMIMMALFIVVYAKGSLRCAAKTVDFYAHLMGWELNAPTQATVDNWVRRRGLYVL